MAYQRPKPTLAHMWPLVAVSVDCCWLWTGRLNENGYGVVKGVLAHRAMYVLTIGPIPEGMQLDHLCRVRNCVRPDHLEPVTQRENTLRGSGFIALLARQTHCKNGHEFTPDNTYVRPGRGGRECRECRYLSRPRAASA